MGTSESTTVTLWGGMVSLYVAKVRSYFIKKGIPFRELMPSDQRFQAELAPTIGYFVIPIVELTDGTIIQDSTDIIVHFESQDIQPSLLPNTPVQDAVSWLLGCLGSECLFKLALHMRWTYIDENIEFIKDSFGASICSRRNETDRAAGAMEFINIIGEKYAHIHGRNPDTIPGIEASYDALLDRMIEHFYLHPFLMGGKPSMADFGFIGAFFAHLARDPYSSKHLKTRAPIVYRWTEYMLEVGSEPPEFSDYEFEFPQNDEVPESTIDILKVMFEEYGAECIAMIDSYNAWCDSQQNSPPGTIIQREGEVPCPHPSLGQIEFEHRGVLNKRHDSVGVVYHFQRVFDVVDALDKESRKRFDAIVAKAGGAELMGSRLRRRIGYTNFRYVLV